jgi:hypothetical protein
VSARAHASAAVGLLGQTCSAASPGERGDRAPQRFGAERESESKTGLGGGAADRFTLRLRNISTRETMTLYARARSARVALPLVTRQQIYTEWRTRSGLPQICSLP